MIKKLTLNPVFWSKKLTLLLLITTDWVNGPQPYLRFVIQGICVLALLTPQKSLFDKIVFSFLAIIFSYKTFLNWWTQDNHLFVLTYWCITLAMSTWFNDSVSIIKENARLILGGSFLFAVIWKGMLSPDFMNGAYFHSSLLFDQRFQQEALLISGLSQQELNSSIANFYRVRNGTLDSAILKSSSALFYSAKLMAWWTLLIELALALAFLAPKRFFISKCRHSLLLCFSWSTYFIVPIVTFGWTLCCLGLSQVEKEDRKTFWLYVLTFILILFYKDNFLQDFIYPASIETIP